ncbi:protein RGF1 INDUCIBLE TRANSCRIPTION FACTOR 1-like [Phragmites australis]|uniref:protein RGF1 INDUCIBLE TRANSCRIPTION FACTOR 1-like n=1 Tax=Phragmites australis TaxID=29695 RepID=UPI002D779B64|nr:protein RGF1 INDUCIBLE TRANSCRIPTION FACTOR 1-like [Phragmites australis]
MQTAAVRGAPQWLRGLLSEEFFDACAAHPGERKNDKNHFCVDCAAALCRHCLPHDPAHDVLQIWKYASCFVVRVDDLKLFDCTGIQSHTVSDHEVVFLNERTARKRSASAENPCAACARPLPSGHNYCSLFCKVKHLGESEQEQGLRRALRANRQAAAGGGEEAEPQNGKRRASSETGPSCGGSFRKRSRKQPEPARSPFC